MVREIILDRKQLKVVYYHTFMTKDPHLAVPLTDHNSEDEGHHWPLVWCASLQGKYSGCPPQWTLLCSQYSRSYTLLKESERRDTRNTHSVKHKPYSQNQTGWWSMMNATRHTSMPVLMAISLSNVVLCKLHFSTASFTLPLPDGDISTSDHSTTVCLHRSPHSPWHDVMVVLLRFSSDGFPEVTRSEVGPGGDGFAHFRAPPPLPASGGPPVVKIDDPGVGEWAQEAVEEMADGWRERRGFHCLE